MPKGEEKLEEASFNRIDERLTYFEVPNLIFLLNSLLETTENEWVLPRKKQLSPKDQFRDPGNPGIKDFPIPNPGIEKSPGFEKPYLLHTLKL